MPETADHIATDLGISRRDSDRFALASQQRYAAANAAGFFADELDPVTVPGPKRGASVVVAADEHPRPASSAEKLAALRPLFDGGVVTAGNASGINDGAAAMVLAEAGAAERAGARPRARILGYAHSGVRPEVMGLGPIPAVQKLLERIGLSVDDFDVIESNEAFAAQACAVNKELGLDTAKVNVNGGAIALGHPIGASGARVLTTLLYEMQKRDAKKGLATLCIGGGMGIAMCLERA
jgi:acetyl-CoA acetyltransferase family protein